MYGAYNQKYRGKSRLDTEAGLYESLHSRTPRWQSVLRRLSLYVFCFVSFFFVVSLFEPQSASYQWVVQEEHAASNALIELEASLVKGKFTILLHMCISQMQRTDASDS